MLTLTATAPDGTTVSATVTYRVSAADDLADMAGGSFLEGSHAVDDVAAVPKDASADKSFYRLVVDVRGY